jgi:hypothetical protein
MLPSFMVRFLFMHLEVCKNIVKKLLYLQEKNYPMTLHALTVQTCITGDRFIEFSFHSVTSHYVRLTCS